MILSDKFIKATNEMCDIDNFVNAPYLRKKFTLDFVPKRAEITICGLGFYELYINGENITKGPLAPYISNTDDVCYYDNYDIAEKLIKGDNVICILLGNGMRNAYGGFVWDFNTAPHRGVPAVALCLEAENVDNKFMLEADESFKTHNSPIIYDDLRMGYMYDARLEIPDWCNADFDDSCWSNAISEISPKGIKKLCMADPIAVTGELKPVSCKHYDEIVYDYCEGKPVTGAKMKDVYVFDFGVNSAGVTKIKINGKPGQKISVRHGELKVGEDYSFNSIAFYRYDYAIQPYNEYAQKDVFICKGGQEEFIPKFKYDGFQYAFVEGVEEDQIKDDFITFIEMNSDVKERAGFKCSDDVLNKIFECARRSDLSNLYYFPTDCPHREKNGWTGDASVSAEHMFLNLTVENTLKEWMTNIRMAQRGDGALPAIVPTGGWGFEWGNGPSWDAVCVNIPYYYYKYTGKCDIIEENANLIYTYLKYIASKRDEKGLIHCGLGDWLDPYFKENGEKNQCPLEFADSAEIYDIAKKAAYLFEKAGYMKEAEYAKALASELRLAIRKNLIDFDTMTVAGNCQTAQAVALERGIFNDDEVKRAQERLVEIVHRDNDAPATGLIGIRNIFHALSNAGESDLAYKMITGKTRTCYGYWIANGATTLWENYDTVNLCNDSHNHHYTCDISSWLIQRVAGLMPNPCCDDTLYFEFAPAFLEKLDWAEAFYISQQGKITVNWQKQNDEILYTLDVPEGIRGKIKLSGDYKFEDNSKEIIIQDGFKGTINLIIKEQRMSK